MQRRTLFSMSLRLASMLAMALLGSAAQAVTISYSNSFSGPTGQTGLPIEVNQFNPSLGTLNGVTITLSGTTSTSLSVNNDGDFYVDWRWSEFWGLDGRSVFAPALLFTVAGPLNIIGPYPIKPNNVTCPNPFVGSCGPITGGFEWSLDGPTLYESQTFTDNAPGAGYAGNGYLPFLLSAASYDSWDAQDTQGGALPVNHTANTSAAVTITYDYTVVPLPASAWLLLSGLGMLRVTVRRRAA